MSEAVVTMNESVVSLDRVSVTYGTQRALRDVSAVFPKGAVGLLGPNGAGKSTMLKSLLGFVTPDSGRLSVLGMNVAEKPRSEEHTSELQSH